MTEAKLEDLRPGDKVRISYVDTVRKAYPSAGLGGSLFGLNSSYGLSTAKLELLERAKPKAGETITGKQLKDTPWRRGTVVKDQGGGIFALQADGTWRDLSTGYLKGEDLDIPFHLFFDHEPLDLLHVA